MYYSTSINNNKADNVSDYRNNLITVEIKILKGKKRIYGEK